MKQHLIASVFVSALLLCPAAQAEEPDTAPSLMERGLQLFLDGIETELMPDLDQGLRDTMRDTMEDLQGLLDQLGPSMQGFWDYMGPALAEIARDVQDWSAYELPEVQPNGDIIIRRKPDAEPETGPDTGPNTGPNTAAPEDAPIDI